MLSLLLLTATLAVGPEPLHTFGDWTVGCDNAGYCKAVSLQPDGPDGFETSIMALERSSAPDAEPRIAIDVRSDEKATAVLIDKTAEKLELSNEGILKGPDAFQFIRRIRRARSIDLADSAGKIITGISVKGASAALRWMDERQGRVGTLSALAAVGTRRFEGGAPSLPAFTGAQRSSKAPAKLTHKQINAIQSGYECPGVEGRRVEYRRLDATTTLALVPCTWGAYQGNSVVMLVSNAGRYRPAVIDFSEGEPAALLFDPEFEAKNLQLWSTYKGRGMGDCGGTDAWLWDGKGFRLIYRNRMDECRGSGHRITLWRTANHPEL